jgi:hypothetical protein
LPSETRVVEGDVPDDVGALLGPATVVPGSQRGEIREALAVLRGHRPHENLHARSSGERLAIDLACRRAWELGAHVDGLRHHVRREAGPQVSLEPGGDDRRARFGLYEGVERVTDVWGRQRHDRDLGHAGHAFEPRPRSPTARCDSHAI